MQISAPKDATECLEMLEFTDHLFRDFYKGYFTFGETKGFIFANDDLLAEVEGNLYVC